MPADKKIYAVANLAEKYKQAKALVLTDYAGLKVSQLSELRREVKKLDAEFEVVKNSLLARAINSKPLIGPTAALWLNQADPAPLKILADFIKKNELPKIKMGYWEGELISAERVLQIAGLPGIKGLQAQLVWMLNSPAYRLANALSWNLKKLLFILGAASTKVTAAKEGVKNNG